MFTVDIPHPGLCFQQHLSLFALLAVLFLSALSSRLGPGRFELAVKRSFLNWGSKREVFLEWSQKHIWKAHSWTSHGFVSYPEGHISSHAVYVYIHTLTSYNLCLSIYSYYRNGSRAEQSGGITRITWIMPIFLPVFLSRPLFLHLALLCMSFSLATILRSSVYNKRHNINDSISQSTWTSRFAQRASFGKREMCSSHVFHCLLNCLGSGSLLPERGLGAAFLWLTQELL